ncbi:hypothetical protein ACFL47_10700 [Candidatus Latescibacterota bacterium]
MELISTYAPIVVGVLAVVAFIYISMVVKAIKLAVKVALGMGIVGVILWYVLNNLH